MLEGAATFLEKLPGFSLRGGLTLAMVGGALEAALHFGIVDPAALNGYVAQGAPVLWVVGVGMVAAAAILGLGTWLIGLKALPSRWKDVREQRSRLTGNIQFLDDDARLLFTFILGMPEGRIESPGNVYPFERLWQMHLLVEENPNALVGGGVPRGMMRIASPLMSIKAGLSRDLFTVLSKAYGVPVTSHADVDKLVSTRMPIWKRHSTDRMGFPM